MSAVEKVRIFRDPRGGVHEESPGRLYVHGFPWKAEGLGISIISVDQPGAFRMVERMLKRRVNRTASIVWTGSCPACNADSGLPCVHFEGPLRGEPMDEPHEARGMDS